jgi:hypothetical protein
MMMIDEQVDEIDVVHQVDHGKKLYLYFIRLIDFLFRSRSSSHEERKSSRKHHRRSRSRSHSKKESKRKRRSPSSRSPVTEKK